VDAVMIRSNVHEDVERFAHWSTVPVINGLSDKSHPCQSLADLMTFEEHRGNVRGRTFAFVQASGLRDRPANISNRFAATTGLGLHLMKRDDEFWDIWAGLGVSQDRYVRPADIRGTLRERYSDSGLVLAEESSLRLGESTSFKQKLAWLPSLREKGQSRVEFDTQLAVAINESLNLSTGLSMRYNSHPAPGLKRLDTALITGLSLRYD